MTPEEAHVHPWKPGDVVLYEPSPGYVFGAVVDSEPFPVLCVRLKALGPSYGVYRGQARDFVPAASCFVLRYAPTLFVNSKWYVIGEEPSCDPAVGRVQFYEGQWRWYAVYSQGGRVASYEAAKLAAEEALR
jgi:hypothetical protein